ncbi:MAG: hypothetical protein HOC09_35445 [Deltaproteobacteria bacterium]|nr:hypothetical protein [Deltaproteobacteria bacterium]
MLDLPEDGQFLIVGGPGTGKSVVALLRALQYGKNGNHVLLMYNLVLESFTKQLVRTGINVKRLLQLLYQKYQNLFREYLPEVDKWKSAYRFWFLLKNQKPCFCLETTGTVWREDGSEFQIDKMYQKDRRIWPLLNSIMGDIL